jgi:hypothetical protein
MDRMRINRVENKIPYASIGILTNAEKIILEKKIQDGEYTNLEKLQVTKYIFQSFMTDNRDDDVCAFYFEQYMSFRLEELNNGRHEIKIDLIESVLSHQKGDKNQIRCNQTIIIRELNSLLGIKSSYENTEITRANIENTIPYLNGARSEVESFFSIPWKQSIKFDTAVSYIKSIYKKWNNCLLKSRLDCHKKVIGYSFTCANVFVRDGVAIPPFDIVNDHRVLDKSHGDQHMDEIRQDAAELREEREDNIKENLKRKHDEKNAEVERETNQRQEEHRRKRSDRDLEIATKRLAHYKLFNNPGAL